ncbi:hypothetical protein ACFVXE_35940 [Streptomyces sp. NPDC058231]|uniref:hypothetical protein n=1 Tax=Streptomyces sp. NPDC058231 TaxID=3346392 RepID=UPI0036E7414C
MARTAHHRPPSQTKQSRSDLSGAPWHSVVLRDLRYSARCLSVAVNGSHRPRPDRGRRRVDVYCFPRHNRDRSIARWSTQRERQARQQLRRQAAAIRGLVYATSGELSAEAADIVDVCPPRHRHSSIWMA